MKGILYLVLAVIAVFLVWGFVKMLLFSVLGLAIKIGLILLFCGLVYMVYKALTSREKSIL